MMNTCQDRGDVQWVMYPLEVDEIGGLCEHAHLHCKDGHQPGYHMHYLK